MKVWKVTRCKISIIKALCHYFVGVYDLFICYNSEDSEKFVANFFLPSLEKAYGYKCFVMERNASGGECKKNIQKVVWQKMHVIFLLLLGIPDVVSTKIRKECKRFVLIMSKNVATDPTCIWACEVAVEKAISGRTHKQLISIYPPDKKKVCSHIYPDVSCL